MFISFSKLLVSFENNKKNHTSFKQVYDGTKKLGSASIETQLSTDDIKTGDLVAVKGHVHRYTKQGVTHTNHQLDAIFLVASAKRPEEDHSISIEL